MIVMIKKIVMNNGIELNLNFNIDCRLRNKHKHHLYTIIEITSIFLFTFH